MRKIVIAITGASGSLYAKILLDKLSLLDKKLYDISLVMSINAKKVWKYELNNEIYTNYNFIKYDNYNFKAPFASGSAQYESMIIIPCSMGILGRIANGISNDLITRSADVILKEKKKLILVIRESPYNIIHVNNMKSIIEAGGVICPASPSFYSIPTTIEEIVITIVERVLNLMNINDIKYYKWGYSKKIL